ncbi:hypothetical protein [Pseudopedobacter sp.]|uniref:hypothetical protein n=1 Tax=Pseudopedobacter sp. TaxID=1936787 RepID=UPI003341C29A
MKINVKTSFIGAILLAFVSLSSCDKVKDAIQADVKVTPNAIEFTIPQVTNLERGRITGVENISKIDLNQYKGLKSINLTSLKVELLDKVSGANFKALEEISIEIKSGTNTAVLAKKLNTDFTNDQYTIEIPVTGGDIDIQNFVKNTFSYDIVGKAHMETSQAVRAKLTAVYTVKFGL